MEGREREREREKGVDSLNMRASVSNIDSEGGDSPKKKIVAESDTEVNRVLW